MAEQLPKDVFLRKAKAKYKQHYTPLLKGSDFKSEMNFIYDETLILRVWLDLFPKIPKVKHRWCTVETIPKN